MPRTPREFDIDDCLPEKEREPAAARCLEKTRRGGEGPLIEAACRVFRRSDGSPSAAVLVTLVPHGDFTDWRTLSWSEPPPPTPSPPIAANRT